MESTGEFINQKYSAILNYTEKRRKNAEQVLIAKRFFGKWNRNFYSLALKEDIFLTFVSSYNKLNMSALAAVFIFDVLLKFVFVKEIID